MIRKSTKELLTESFRELAKAKTVDKITIQEIVENCGYSIATFYRHFKDKYELIAWDYTRSQDAVMDRLRAGERSWEQALVESLREFEQNRDYLGNLILHTGGSDSFAWAMTEIHCGLLRSLLLEKSGEGELGREQELSIRVYCLGAVGLVCEWILGKHALRPEELARILQNTMPQSLQAELD